MTYDDQNNVVIRRRSGKSTGHQEEIFTFTTAMFDAASISQTGLLRFRLSLVSEMTGLQHHAELKDSQAETLTDCDCGARERTDLSNSSLQWVFSLHNKRSQPTPPAVCDSVCGRRYTKNNTQRPLRDKAKQPFNNLSKREYKIMKLLITGLTLKSIQGEAGISVKLASKHWIRIFEKLDVQNEFALFKLPMRIN